MSVQDLPQGDVRLLYTDTAQQLLSSTHLARVAYVAHDGTPRVFPMLFHWTGDELVMCTFAGARKIKAIRRSPVIAVTIDHPTHPRVCSCFVAGQRLMRWRGAATVLTSSRH